MNVVVIHSGGLDSSVLLYHLQHEGATVRALSVDYGQRHRKELASASEICASLGIEHQVADISAVQPLLACGALTGDDEVPDGHYTDSSMKVTIVPNRNMILLSLAIGWAVSLKYDAVAYAAHSGDHAIYPDCREAFTSAMREAAHLCDWRRIDLLTPFVQLDKAAIVRIGADLAVPFAKTWSCYKGGDMHCGTCGTCVERREAFELAGVHDPTPYDSDRH
jgi:7-cyano-7-deazaguanine synthase